MIRKLVQQMLTAQIFSALTVSVCLLIDNVMISRFLGETAMASYSLSNPVLLGIGAVASLLSAGIQVACSKSLGRGSQQETNAGYSTAIVLGAGISVFFTALVLLFQSPLASLLGAGREGKLFEETRGYLAGFSIGAPASMGALILVPFLQMAGKSGLLIASVLAMTVSDVALDLLNVLVFHGGMFGMGLASSLSYFIAVITACFYFCSRKCVFCFSWKLISRKKAAEILRGGIPAGFNMASCVILVFVLNRLLQQSGGETAVAAYAVISGLGNAANCITTGIGGVSLTLSGILFNEEDRNGLRELIGTLCRYSAILGFVVGILLAVFSPFLVSIFITEEGTLQHMAVLGLRLFAAGMIPCCINNALKSLYQANGNEHLTELISLAECAVFPALAAWLLGTAMGTDGVWLFFVAGEILALLMIGGLVIFLTRTAPWQNGAYLLLKKDFGVAEDHLLEASVRNLQEMNSFVKKTEQFCLSLGEAPQSSNHIALCIEEVAGNVILHGFPRDTRPHHLSIRLLQKEKHWILRFRDDCQAFDPVHYVPADREDALGLRLVLALTEKASYTYSLNMNNLTLRLRRNTLPPAENRH